MAEYITKLNELLSVAVREKASDLHISANHHPVLRIAGRLVPLVREEILSAEDAQGLAFGLMTEEQRQRLNQEKEIDFSYNFENKSRFRINIFFQRGYISS